MSVDYRFVRWENGSLSLMVGDECFDVDERGVDNIYLYARHPTVMQVAYVQQLSDLEPQHAAASS